MLNLILALLTQRIIIPGIDGTLFNFNQGCKNFPKSRNQLKILGIRRVTLRMLHT